MLANILVYDIGSTYTKAAAFNLDHGRFTYLGRGQFPTTLENILDGANCAVEAIKAQGITFSDDLRRYSSCSAAGGLRMVALGYMPRVTAKAAKEVAMTAGARVMQVISSEEPLSYRKEVLIEISPDIILLSGGTDGGDESCAMENAKMICELHSRATVIIACNKYAQRAVAELFDQNGVAYVRVPNIMPTIHELHVKPAREAIHEQFIKQITKAQGLIEFRNHLDDQTVVPTPGAVLLASELLSRGTYEQDGIGSLILVDIGGATTDIHSALPELENLTIEERGLVINNEKQFSYRTVEGNLGLRVSATGIPDAVGPDAIIREIDLPCDIAPEDISAFTQKLEKDPSYIPESETEKSLERALAVCAIRVALRRHAGHYAEAADPVMGIMAGTAIGRDLRNTQYVLCVGGIFVHTPFDKTQTLIHRCFETPGISLLPLRDPDVLFDRSYILYAMGVLGKHYPDAALSFLKEYVGRK